MSAGTHRRHLGGGGGGASTPGPIPGLDEGGVVYGRPV